MKNADIIDFLQSDGLKNLLELKGRIAPPAVFTSGVFDLVHAGHLDYLQAASLRFHYDDSLKRGARINELIHHALKSDQHD